MEGKLVSDLLLKVANEDGFGEWKAGLLKAQLKAFSPMFEGLGFCLSAEDDLLSQWRGYANDAKGFSIGFSLDALKLACNQSSKNNKLKNPLTTLQPIEYDEAKQKEIVKELYIPLKAELDTLEQLQKHRNPTAAHKKQRSQCVSLLSSLLTDLPKISFSFKSKAFIEEQEWRLVSYLMDIHLDPKDNNALCNFRSKDDCITPFREFHFDKEDRSLITEVILGPKNVTPIHVVESLLKQAGYDNVEVKPSKASYR